jgi:hypothetical protein
LMTIARVLWAELYLIAPDGACAVTEVREVSDYTFLLFLIVRARKLVVSLRSSVRYRGKMERSEQCAAGDRAKMPFGEAVGRARDAVSARLGNGSGSTHA